MAIPAPAQGETIHANNAYGGTAYGGIDALRVRSRPEFFFGHDAGAWERGTARGETWWLPSLFPHLIRAGSAGNRTLTKAEMEAGQRTNAYSGALAERKARGIIYLDGSPGTVGPMSVLPPEFVPPIPDEFAMHLPARPGYAVRYPSVDPRRGVPGEHWTEIWNVPQPGIASREIRFVFDHERFNAWRLWLIETGVIEGPQAYVVGEDVARIARRVERAAVHPDPEIRADKVAKMEADLQAAESARIPELAEDAAPRNRRGRKAKPEAE